MKDFLPHPRKIRIIIIVYILLFLINIILILKNNAKDYEESIYSNLPVVVWILIILSIICGIIFMLIFNKKDNYWLFGLIIILSNNALILLLPVLKGYYLFGRSDSLTHVGLIKDILSYGYFDKDNFYPITHILFSEIALIADILPSSLFNYMPAFINIVYVLFMYLFAKAILNKKEYILIATASATIFSLGSFHTQIIPNGMANFLYPLILAIIFLGMSKKSFDYKILLILLIVLFPFIHPLTAIALIFTIIVIKLSYFHMRISDLYNKEIFDNLQLKLTTTLLISLIVFVSWMSTFWVWGQNIRYNLNWFFGEVNTGPISPINDIAHTLNYIGLKGSDIIELNIKLYGHLFIFICLSLFASSILIKKIVKDRKYEYQNFFSCVVIFFGFILFLIFVLIVPMSFGALRVMAYLAIISIVLGSFGIYDFAKDKLGQRKYITLSLIVLIALIVPMVIGIFSVYESPFILKPNLQITYAEIDGYEWTFKYKNPGIAVSTIMSSQPYRFIDVLWGIKARQNRSDVKDYGVRPEAIIPDHFNYTNNTMVGNSYSTDKYILISEYDKHLYAGVWKSIGRYNSSDFQRIKNDPSMQNIYSNGGFDTWMVMSRT